MKYILTLVFLLSLSGILRAEEISLPPKPVPKPTTPRIMMDVEQGESLSSKSAKAELKDLASRLKQDNDFAYIICYEKNDRSKKALRMANQIKNYLVKKEGIKSDRIVVVLGGNSDILKIKIYLVPPEKSAENSTEKTHDPDEVLNYRAEQTGKIPRLSYRNQPINVSKTPVYEIKY